MHLTRLRPIAAALVFAALAAPAAADTLRVPQDFPTLQAAVDASNENDIIVASGKQLSPVVISNRANLTIRGVGGATIDAQGDDYGIDILDSTGIEVSKLRVQGTDNAAIRVQDSDDVTLSKCTIDGQHFGSGIFVEDSTGVRIERVKVKTLPGEGIHITSSNDTASSDCTVSRCNVSKVAEDGIDAQGSGHLFEKNRIDRVEDEGINAGTPGRAMKLIANRINRAGSDGVQIDPDDCRVERNIVTTPDGDGFEIDGDDGTYLKNKVIAAENSAYDVGGQGNVFTQNQSLNSRGNGFNVEDENNTFRQNIAVKSKVWGLEDRTETDTNVYEANKFDKIIFR